MLPEQMQGWVISAETTHLAVIGQFGDKAEADDFSNRLKNEGFPSEVYDARLLSLQEAKKE